MKKIIYSILFILMLIIIFMFSSQNGEESLNLTINGIDKVVNITNNKENIENNNKNNITNNETNINKKENKESLIDKLIKPVRKSAHFIEFMILGIITSLLLKSFKIKNIYLIIISLLFCFIYACTDEIHQLFVIGRTSSFIDVLIDTSGSFTGIMIIYILGKRRCKNENNI